MKKVMLPIAILGGGIAGVIVGLLMPPEARGQLSRKLVPLIGGMVERCPDG
jgi:hypothetical protein